METYAVPSAVVSVRATYRSDHVESGLFVPHLEAGLQGYAAAELRGDVFLSIDDLRSVGAREAYVTYCPYAPVAIVAGKVLAAVGFSNRLHPHEFPFRDRPLIHAELFGPDGLAEVGFSARWVLPFRPWTELTVQVLEGTNAYLFASGDDFDLAYVGRLASQATLPRHLVLAAALSGAVGRNFFGGLSILGGGALRIAYLPPPGAGPAFDLDLEYLVARRGARQPPHQGGLAAAARVRVARSWWISGRFDLLGLALLTSEPLDWRATGLVAFAPLDGASLRLQYAFLRPVNGGARHEVTLHIEVGLGPHRAHAFAEIPRPAESAP